ncbi:MAG: hypothetical protein COV67_07780 [Nitrospinae bacterium CG11_big_fil_rev_8_21_14_0_20_56_8]|nr:MAG: hypothetical protein COV67_07780 [Nitrospinae bacterium CG11_big_fil_rev_8_21_14_0_20_56_8]
MSQIKIAELNEAPPEGESRRLFLEHPFTHFKYQLALIRQEGILYCLTDLCPKCGGSFGRGKVAGKYAICHNLECAWSLKKGICKFDHSQTIPVYKVTPAADGIYIEI